MPFKRWFITLIVIVVIAAVICLFIFWHPGAAPQPGAAASSTTESAGSVTSTASNGGGTTGGTTTGASKPSSHGGGANVPIVPSAPITINLITPISNNAWTIGGQNSIAWDTPAGITGEIDLVNATTKAFIGVILSETGPNQTSYTWDARSIYLARYSADKKDVVPGTYSIRIHFDGRGLGDLVSGPITISN
jgi:hypothetical protein